MNSDTTTYAHFTKLNRHVEVSNLYKVVFQKIFWISRSIAKWLRNEVKTNGHQSPHIDPIEFSSPQVTVQVFMVLYSGIQTHTRQCSSLYNLLDYSVF